MKRGFTILEMILVLAVLGILMGIITTAASASIRQARTRKAQACCKIVQEGIATYYAQQGKWPISLSSGATNTEGLDGTDDDDLVVLTGEQVKKLIYEVVQQTKAGNPCMDVSGLFVSQNPGEAKSKATGLDFMEAIHGTRTNRKKLTSSQMYFGYPDVDTGYFRRFKIVYSKPTDSMTVSTQ